MNTWTGLYRRAFLEEHQIRHNETPGASYQDNGFWFQTIMYAERVYYVDRAFYQLRRGFRCFKEKGLKYTVRYTVQKIGGKGK